MRSVVVMKVCCLFAGAMFLWLAQPAMATSDLQCSAGVNDDVSVDFIYGAGIAGVQNLRVKGQSWSDPGYEDTSAKAIFVVAANEADREDDNAITADLAETQGGPVIATLRTLKSVHPHERPETRTAMALASAGVFWMKDVGEWTVRCDVP